MKIYFMKEPHWYAVYTKARAEKKTADLLKKSGVEVYLPMQKTLRQWSDRKKWVEAPLIRSYLFVKTNLSNYFDILNTQGVVRIITFEGKPAPIPDHQIIALQRLISNEIEIETIDTEIPEGSPVEIIHGSLKGIKGELVRQGSKKKVIIRMNHLSTSFSINIPINYIKITK